MSDRGWESGLEGVNEITETIIGSAIAVHRSLGPGLLESTYRAALCLELDARGVRYRGEVAAPILYRGVKVGAYRLDLIVESCVIVEVKSVDYLHSVFEAQLLASLRVTGERVGLLINFNERYLKDGVRRFINDLSVKRGAEAQRCPAEVPFGAPSARGVKVARPGEYEPSPRRSCSPGRPPSLQRSAPPTAEGPLPHATRRSVSLCLS